jgi:pyridoxamine 5'-phosphate oxidase
MNDIARLRREYEDHGLDIEDIDPDPIVQFQRWFTDLREAGFFEPHAMVLATIDRDGWPDGRTVLLKGVDAGFVFYTHYASAKGRALDATGRAALTFPWTEVRRQVRVVGPATRVSAAESDAYFASRPRGSQLSTWASDQSEVVPSRAVLDRRYAQVEQRYGDAPIPRPPQWGGYRVVPTEVELWQGRENRLHDRLRYVRTPDGGWHIQRIAP